LKIAVQGPDLMAHPSNIHDKDRSVKEVERNCHCLFLKSNETHTHVPWTKSRVDLLCAADGTLTTVLEMLNLLHFLQEGSVRKSIGIIFLSVIR
jgi:hypothetical protein